MIKQVIGDIFTTSTRSSSGAPPKKKTPRVRVAWGHPQPGDVLERHVFASCHVAEMGENWGKTRNIWWLMVVNDG